MPNGDGFDLEDVNIVAIILAKVLVFTTSLSCEFDFLALV